MFLVIIYLPWGALHRTSNGAGDDRRHQPSRAHRARGGNAPLLDDCSMHGAKGVLINITGGSDITLFEIDEAASRIKEEVDEDANIIFGSSFDETLEGKIRVSIVATGIGEGTVARPKAPQPVKYVEESFTEEKIVPQVPSPELDSNLEKFSATKTETSEDIQEIIDNVSIVSLESQTAVR